MCILAQTNISCVDYSPRLPVAEHQREYCRLCQGVVESPRLIPLETRGGMTPRRLAWSFCEFCGRGDVRLQVLNNMAWQDVLVMPGLSADAFTTLFGSHLADPPSPEPPPDPSPPASATASPSPPARRPGRRRRR